MKHRSMLELVTLANLTDHLGLARGEQVAVDLADPLCLQGFEMRFWTYEDIARFVSKASCALKEVGVSEGESVIVCMSNGFDTCLMALAVIRCGARVVPISRQSSADELGFIAGDCGAVMLVSDDKVLKRLGRSLKRAWESLKGVLIGPGVSREGAPEEMLGEGVGCWRLSELMERESAGVAYALDQDEVCAIFYTSGTTGKPKGAMLTSGTIMGGVKARGWMLRIRSPIQMRLLIALPVAHIMGFATTLLPMLAGVTIRYHAWFDAKRVLDDLEEGEIDFFVGVPSMYELLMREGASGRDLRGVKVFGSAADVMPGDQIRRFKGYGRSLRWGSVEVPALFVEAYGSVELSGAALVRLSLPWMTPTKDGFLGMALPGYKVRIRDEEGRNLAIGQEGELQVKGPGVLKGYLGKKSAGVVEGGWLRTGDIAKRSGSGLIKFVGRRKEVIKVGGYSVFPAEVEAVMLEHPAVSGCAVVGIPDQVKGSIPVAVVVLLEDSGVCEAELRDWMRGRIAPYKAPRRVMEVSREEMPYGPTGKIKKRLLVDLIKVEFDSGA